uniref:Phospholipid phosphatase 3 n=1 Tax=Eptatretus burgeri TaxID=7764 RepID=A0A8C4QV63_EPTBU
MAAGNYSYTAAADGDSEGCTESNGRALRTSPSRAGSVALLALDLLCFVLVSLPFLLVELNLIRPFKRGFYCDDESIRYPYLTDTISDGVLSAGGLLMAILLLGLGECFFFQPCPVCPPDGQLLVALYRNLGSYLFGAAATLSLTAVAKTTVGRLRPHFLDVCKPDPARLNCSVGYIIPDLCLGHPKDVNEARKSFFSGHASFSLYTMLFLILYLEVRLTWRGARTLRPFVQFMLLLGALYVGLSRVSDYKHHWSDVMVGFIIGAACAILTVYLFTDLLRTKRGRQSQWRTPRQRNTEEGLACLPPETERQRQATIGLEGSSPEPSEGV